MNRSTLRDCLTYLATVKKNLIINQGLELVWFQALESLSDSAGKKAFKVLFRTRTFGDPEPADVLQIAEEQEQEQLQGAEDGTPWISKAPKFVGERWQDNACTIATKEFANWLVVERQRLYKAVDRDNNIILIQNPEAWDFEIRNGSRVAVRGDTEETGKVKATPRPAKGGRAWA